MAAAAAAAAAALSCLRDLHGSWRELVRLYRRMVLDGALRPDTFTFPVLLASCPSLPPGEALHADALKRALGSGADPFVSSAIIDMYCRCGASSSTAHRLFDEMPHPKPVIWNAAISAFFRVGRCDAARDLFDRMPCPNDITWSAVVAGYSQNGRASDALLAFKRMMAELGSSRSVPNSHTLAAVLTACVHLRDLTFAVQVHGYAIKISDYVEKDAFVGSVLLDVYGKCGTVALARKVFDSMTQKTVVAWSSLIADYLHSNDAAAALRFFREMVFSGALPNDVTLTTALSACARIQGLQFGKELHCYMLRRSSGSLDSYASCALMDMYGRCGSMASARSIFEGDGEVSGHRAAPMWNTIISGYVANDHLENAWRMIRSFCQLRSGEARPSSVTLAIVLPLCAASSFLLFGKEIHCYALKNGLSTELLVGNSLLDMYCKCGELNNADNLFNVMSQKNRISWTTLIDGYGMHGHAEAAMNAFQRMVGEEGIEPDPITFVGLISACSHAGLVEDGLGYFRRMTEEHGMAPTEEVAGCMVDLLARAGHVGEAKEFIAKMPVKASASTWGALLGAGRVHGEADGAEAAVKHLSELEADGSGFRTLLSNIYAERGQLEEAARVRETMTRLGKNPKRRGCSRVEPQLSC